VLPKRVCLRNKALVLAESEYQGVFRLHYPLLMYPFVMASAAL